MSERSQVSWGALVGLLAILVGCVFMITTYKRQDARMVFDCIDGSKGKALGIAHYLLAADVRSNREEVAREFIQACQNLVEELN